MNEMLAKYRLSQKTLHSSRMGPDNNRHGASEEMPWCRVTLKLRELHKVQLKTSRSEAFKLVAVSSHRSDRPYFRKAVRN